MPRMLVALLIGIVGLALLVFSIGRVPGPETVMTPGERVAATPQGALKNPFDPSDAAIAAEGKALFAKSECVGCHGADASGHVCPSAINSVWVYGDDDDTLFRLIAIGTGPLQQAGYRRKARETKVGPMPGMGSLIETDRDLWKIVTWLRSRASGAGTAQ
ncbi:c-type cytochrome [Methyloligella sp. 2.7D]|uniref:c-type cytochrome n=1 Tax=unclassified Methyloligella TaxID=2625955 RepID=UPI00157C2AF9|nr:c-type cytochrome [Methyloligella sp. GL2]QKP78287.1 c-type cytochrome [Methyloligella sp. GL2]